MTLFHTSILYTYYLILLITLLISLRIYTYKQAPLYLKLFPPFLLLTLIVEIAGHIMRVQNLGNIALFNFFSTFEFIFYFYIVYQLVSTRAVKIIIQLSIFIYPVLALLNIFYLQGFKAVHTFTIHFASLLLVIFCGTYLIETIKRDALSQALRTPSFWICAGLLFFYSIYLPLVGAMSISSALPIFDAYVIQAMQVFPNYILYSSYAIAFICFYRFQRLYLTHP